MQEKFWILLKFSHLFIQWYTDILLMSGMAQKCGILILFVTREQIRAVC